MSHMVAGIDPLTAVCRTSNSTVLAPDGKQTVLKCIHKIFFIEKKDSIIRRLANINLPKFESCDVDSGTVPFNNELEDNCR
jgi:hypothetical protein